MTEPPSPELYETVYGRIQKHPDGIICLYMFDNLQIERSDAMQMVSDVRSLEQSSPIRLMVVYGQNSDLSFSAQRYFASVTGFSHVAFVVHTNLQVQVGQFLVSLLKALKSMYEFRLFYDKDAALDWLRQP